MGFLGSLQGFFKALGFGVDYNEDNQNENEDNLVCGKCKYLAPAAYVEDSYINKTVCLNPASPYFENQVYDTHYCHKFCEGSFNKYNFDCEKYRL